TVRAYDKYKFGFGKGYIREANPEQTGRYADVVSLHVPLSEETFHMANEAFFNSLEKKPFFLNTSRGKVVSNPDLIAGLKSGRIAGAGLEALENERLERCTREGREQLKWLVAQPSVVVTAHIAGYSREASYKMAKVLGEKLFGNACGVRGRG